MIELDEHLANKLAGLKKWADEQNRKNKNIRVTVKLSCSKCPDEAQPDTSPPVCVDHMAQRGGGNDLETADEN